MKKLFTNILLALIITTLFVAVEQLYRIYNDILTFNLDSKSFLEQFIIHLLIVSIISRRAILITYTILALFTWFQLLHFGYFGTWIFPLEYMLFFTQFQETYDTFITVTDIAIVPSIMIVVMLVLIYSIILKHNQNRLKIPLLGYCLIAFLIFIPLRVYLKDAKKGHRPNVEHYTIKNTFNNLGYLIGNIIPKKISGNSGLEQPIVETPAIVSKNPDINVVMIMGESLHREYMSLYGYAVETTPFLKSLQNDKNFLYKRGIGSGVVTDVAVPSFFNMIKKPDGVPQILSTNTCMFKMAKENGFETYFYSSQSQNQLSHLKNYLCMKWIDNYKDGTIITNDRKLPAVDEFLVNMIDTIDFSKSNFIALQQRASHTPFRETFPDEFEVFTKENSQEGLLQNTIDYHNSIHYTDYILSKIIEKIKTKTTKPTYFVFTSDHATNLGDKDRNGHGRLDYDSVYQIPFFVYSINDAVNINHKFTDFEYISHYQMGNVVSHLLGYQEVHSPFNVKEDFYVCDSDISGLAGVLKVSFDEENKQVPILMK